MPRPSSSSWTVPSLYLRTHLNSYTPGSWTLVSNCAFGVFFTGQQGLDIVVTLGHNLGKDLAGFVSGVGCQVFHGISGF
jgi:hypothetical protein